MSKNECIITEVKDSVGLVYIDRTEVMNALNRTLIVELGNKIKDMCADAGVRAIIISGKGDHFAAGADIGEMAQQNPHQALAFSFNDVYTMIEQLPVPTCAAIKGYALGGGLELALACDFRICHTSAKLGLPEIKLGIIPGAGGTQRLPRLIGLSRAKEIIFSGEFITAEKAYQWGLCDRLTDNDPVLEAVSFLSTIIKRPSLALQAAKKSIMFGLDSSLKEGLEYEALSFGILFSTHDQKEGMKAFIEKRKPNFKGC
ncbi:MAG TPA: enoyl-CoA hydratase/isomerase family protein [Spirochaetota bacterium]|nr:enoyl-CoA hydratase/isomerase family protein [Spirochaetota bacterium]HOM09554.1 enoyl-CoA hydratase/isomerase family protein [Spirochaetota bacterium]HPP49414.1 enoyl-CoA hydratase/isomerase family protein [Spirochaetota bacterium]